MDQTQTKKQKISLNDGLQKQKPEEIIEELKKVLYQDENMNRFFPEERQKRYGENFKLFDRDYDGNINLSELKELLISINQVFPDDELEELYGALQYPDKEGISFDQLLILVSKKIRDDDKEEQLTEAFKLLDKENTQTIDSELFKEKLMTMGDKWPEDKADEFMKDADPKGEGKFNYQDLVKKLMKR